ncbi:MAG: DUF4126 domain-containing protein [Acidobacteriaceae bacterium]
MYFSASEWFALAISASFAAGLNVYATVATMGLLARSGVLQLPPALASIGNWWVIGAALALFALEFVADKIPVFDLLWNALHTFVRIPIAALIAYGATQRLSPQAQILAAVLGGLVALIAHSGKLAARSVVTPSPEPVSNAALSLGEDVGAIGLTWFATHHPFIAAGVTGAAVITLIFAVHWLVRGVRRFFSSADQAIHRVEA